MTLLRDAPKRPHAPSFSQLVPKAISSMVFFEPEPVPRKYMNLLGVLLPIACFRVADQVVGVP